MTEPGTIPCDRCNGSGIASWRPQYDTSGRVFHVGLPCFKCYGTGRLAIRVEGAPAPAPSAKPGRREGQT